MANYRATYTAAEKRLFADKLRKAMVDKGWNGAELARRISKHLPSPTPRQSVSSWLIGASIPEEANLRAIEKTLDIPAGHLLPRPHKLAPGEPDTTPAGEQQDVRMALIGDGKMRLVLTVEVPQSVGWQILELLKAAGH